MRFGGIGLRLGVLLASFGLLAMSIVAWYFYSNSRAEVVATAQRDLLTSVHVLARNLQSTTDQVAKHTLFLSLLPEAGEIATNPTDPKNARKKQIMTETLTAMMQTHAEYFQIRLIGLANHGLELVRVDREGEKLVEVTGNRLQEKGHFDYVYGAMQLRRGQVHLSEITINHEEGAHSGLDKPTVRVTTPVFGADGHAVGLIVINLDINGLFVMLKSDLPVAYQVYLTNQWGDYLIHPDRTKAFGFDYGRRIYVQDSFPEVARLINGPLEHVVTEADVDPVEGTRLVAAFVRVPFGGSVGTNFVTLGLSLPSENVVRVTSQLGWNTLKMILVLGAVAVLLAYIVSRAVTNPLRSMAHAIEQFSKDQIVSVMPSDHQDEIGLLTRTLHDMQNTIVANVQELTQSRQALKHLALHDALTGLPNRALFEDRLRQSVAQARRDSTRMALMFVDLDSFKPVNDVHGHHVGDLLLKAVSQRMGNCVRSVDTVARLGGDEFVVLLPLVDTDRDALLVAGKVCTALNKPIVIEGLELNVSSSVGMAIFPDHGANEEALMRSADAAMYHSKESGGNQVTLYGHFEGTPNKGRHAARDSDHGKLTEGEV